jgi:hypothetical protein
MILTDVLMTVFAVRGVGASVAAHQRLANAQTAVTMAQNAYHRALAGGNALAIANAHLRVQMATRSAVAQTTSAIGSNIVMIGAIMFALERATKVASDFAHEIMNIMDLTGSSARESVFAVMLGKAAGMSDITQMRELLKLNAAVFSTQGQSALARLGIPVNPNESGLDLFLRVSKALEGMQDGLRKTQIMEEIFGQRAVAAMLPLLRMTEAQRDAVRKLSEEYDVKVLPMMQQFQFQANYLQLVIMSKIVFPIANHVIPIFQSWIDVMVVLIDWFNRLDRLMGGIPSWVVTVLALAVAFGYVVNTIIQLRLVYILLRGALIGVFLVQAAIAILAGQYGRVVQALAFLAIGGFVINHLLSGDDDKKAENDPAKKMDKAVDKFRQAVDKMTDSFSDVAGRGIPGGLRPQDIPAIERQLGLDAIG